MWDNTVFALFGPQFDSGLAATAIITIMPLAFATMIEHIGDISAIGSTCERNYIADPGLHRTLLGDGLATILASLFGAPANTTYGENTGVLALTRVFDPRVIRIAACCAIVLSFCPEFAAVIAAMPACVIGGVSLVLYGMISAVASATSSRTRSISRTTATCWLPRWCSCFRSASRTAPPAPSC